jgi:seryl-tRNA synthetase
VGRTWLAILENYQQADGSVLIPERSGPTWAAWSGLQGKV